MYYDSPYMFRGAPLPPGARRNGGAPESANGLVLRLVAERLDDPGFTAELFKMLKGHVDSMDPNAYGSQQSLTGYGPDGRKGFNSKMYKTQLCKTYMEKGECPFYEKCQFAHGQADLRTPAVRNPKYKMVSCRNYAANRYCPYNERCEYIHDEAPEQIEALRAGMSAAASKAGSEAGDAYAGGSGDPSATAAPHAVGAAANGGERTDASTSEHAQLLEYGKYVVSLPEFRH
ncbi:hypothetical protein AAVH_23760 [Aphelenchoides avenae]|nr:hypothetical protein AAVH_23760 [Aphelenchus avenae]